MANADMCLEAARKAFPNNEELRVAYMIGFNEGFDMATEQSEVDLRKEIGRWMDKLDDKYCMFVENYSIQDIKDTAKYFYELGLNARKEE